MSFHAARDAALAASRDRSAAEAEWNTHAFIRANFEDAPSYIEWRMHEDGTLDQVKQRSETSALPYFVEWEWNKHRSLLIGLFPDVTAYAAWRKQEGNTVKGLIDAIDAGKLEGVAPGTRSFARHSLMVLGATRVLKVACDG